MSIECKHGYLARTCDQCEADAEIARLTRERDEARQALEAERAMRRHAWTAALILANNLCVRVSDDHNADDEISKSAAAAECAERIRSYLAATPTDIDELIAEANSAIESALAAEGGEG